MTPAPSRLIVIRHGDIGDGRSDDSTPLSDLGRQQTARLHDRLSQIPGINQSIILTAPANRARQTAAAIGDLVEAEVIPVAWLYYGTDYARQLWGLLEDAGEAPCVILVGHAPMVQNAFIMAGVPGARQAAASHAQPFFFDLDPTSATPVTIVEAWTS